MTSRRGPGQSFRFVRKGRLGFLIHLHRDNPSMRSPRVLPGLNRVPESSVNNQNVHTAEGVVALCLDDWPAADWRGPNPAGPLLCSGIGPFFCRPLPTESSNLEKNVEGVDQVLKQFLLVFSTTFECFSFQLVRIKSTSITAEVDPTFGSYAANDRLNGTTSKFETLQALRNP
jgi:hypothetical protein